MLSASMPDEDRPLPPTARKLRKARERGEVPRSALASAALVLLGGGAAIALTAEASIASWRAFAARAFAGEGSLEEAIGVAAGALVWPLVAVSVAAVSAGVLQVGPLFTAKPLAPDLGRLDPGEGLRRMFSGPEIVGRTAPLLLVLVLAAIAAVVGLEALRGLAGRVAVAPEAALGFAGTSLGALFAYACGAFVVAGAIALARVRHRYLEDQRMSRRERREEERETRGEPAARRARARRRRELAMGPPLEEALEGAALVLRGRDVAVVVGWPSKKETPRVAFVARGHALARLSRLRDGPEAADATLAAELARVPLGGPVPRALWRRLAEHLARLA